MRGAGRKEYFEEWKTAPRYVTICYRNENGRNFAKKGKNKRNVSFGENVTICYRLHTYLQYLPTGKYMKERGTYVPRKKVFEIVDKLLIRC